MEVWYCMSLGDGMTASTPSDEIQEAFQRSFAAGGERKDMAVFTRPESEGRLYCEIMAYFSPAAREVALAFDAGPCAKPARAGLNLLAGDQDAWSLLFPSGG